MLAGMSLPAQVTPATGRRLTERRKELITGLSVIVVFVVGFGVSETVLRVLQSMKYGGAVDSSTAFYREEGTGLRLPRPGVRVGRVQINSLGFRGPALSIPRPPDTVRLAFLGSSTTYDAESPEGHNWPELTARKLEAELPPGCRLDFANAGLPGFSVEHMRTHFEAHVRAIQPDIVIILSSAVTNDVQDDLAARGVQVVDLVRPSWLGARSFLWQRIEKNVRIVRLQRAAFRPQGKIAFDHETHAVSFERRLTALVASVKLTGALPVLVATTSQLRREQSPREQLAASTTALFYTPFMSIPGLLDARDAYNAAIRRTAQRTGVVLVRGENDIPADREHFLDTAHFTLRGSERMAERVATALRGNADVQARIGDVGGACRSNRRGA